MIHTLLTADLVAHRQLSLRTDAARWRLRRRADRSVRRPSTRP